jgi:pimeloyl-ACP methyl ester carboxylesterase
VRAEDFRILLLAPAVFVASVGWVVIAGVLFCAWAKRGDVMDEHQASVFGCVRVSRLHRAWSLLVEIVYQSLSLVLRTLYAWRLLPLPRGAPGCTPVLVVPGYTENAGTMWPLGWRLARAGFNPILIDFPSTLHRIESNAEFLARRIEEVRAVSGAAQVAVVAHSMGGLITRTLLHSCDDHGVIAFVAIASPFRGTHLARIGAPLRIGHCLEQMCPGSEFMQRFPPTLAARVPMLSMIACQENIVSPEWSAVIAGAETRVLSEPWGHQTPLFMREVYEHAEAWLLAHGVTRRATS